MKVRGIIMHISNVFRIIDWLNITGTGLIYIIRIDDNSILRIGDVLYDLQGNSFKVKGIEMFHTQFKDLEYGKDVVGIMFDSVDGIGVEGNILVRDLYDISFLFCNHPLYPKKVDEDYEEEFQTAGLEHPCALFSYEDLEEGKLSLYGERISGLTVYRGWMLKPDLYKLLYEKLEEQGIILINQPEEYNRYHMLPGWYNDFKEETPYSIWENEGTVDSAFQLRKGLKGAYIVKDYVKSRKHEWFDACYINNIEDESNSESIIKNFIERQGTDLVGGVVLRQFEKLNSIGYHEKSGMPISEEYRIFVFAGRIMTVSHYWQESKTIGLSDDEWAWLENCSKKVKSNFITMDIARREDGKLIIMELGDGQVSGLQQIKPKEFYDQFFKRTIGWQK